ncbi:MAG: YdbL family protein [Desulfobacteraceae bacterium]
MKRATFCSLMMIISVILLSATTAFSQGIKERIKERLPVIVELKNKGIVGENNLGFLEFVGNKKEKEDVVEAENNDRAKVYEAIAKKQNTTAQKVGERRAKQIVEKADPGEWLKDESGKWYQKK